MNIRFPWFGKAYIRVIIHKNPSTLRMIRYLLDADGDVIYADQIFSVTIEI